MAKATPYLSKSFGRSLQQKRIAGTICSKNVTPMALFVPSVAVIGKRLGNAQNDENRKEVLFL